jgi:NTE family protein
MLRCGRRSRGWLLAAAAGCLCLIAPVRAQEGRAPDRPRIGLALAGGSALGLAHVGVLEWLEEHRIPIDFIAGTSMGGLVAGCYAAGMSPAEMRALVGGVDWPTALGQEPPYTALDFRRQQDYRAVPSRLEIGLRRGIQFRSGVSPAALVDLLLSRVALPYTELRSFDELPIPFRCVAVDMATGTPLTLQDGSLATALRATMSIPAFFTPVKRDGKLLTDGGTLNNLPTEAVKAMGANLIIAVDLHSTLEDVEQLRSLIDILGQTMAIAIKENERRSLALADVVITPELGGLTGLDFSQVVEFAERGHKAAEMRAVVLERLSLSEEAWQAHLAQRQAKEPAASLTPAFVRVTGVEGPIAAAMERRLQGFVGEPLSTDRLDSRLTEITGSGRFQSLVYERAREEGQDGLVIHAKPKSYGPPFLRLGLEVDGGDPDSVKFGVGGRLTALDVGAPGAEARLDLRVGTEPRVDAEYYRPFGVSPWFVAPRLFFHEDRTNLYEDGDQVAIYRVRTPGAGIDLGYRSSRRSEVRLGYETGDLDAQVVTGDPALPSVSGRTNAAVLRWGFEGQDSPIVPTRGTRAELTSRYYFDAPGAEGSFPSLQLGSSHFHPLSRAETLFGRLLIGTTFGSEAPPAQQFTLGGPLRLGAYEVDEFRGNHSLLFSLGYLRHVYQLPPGLGTRVLLGAWYEVGNVSDDRLGQGKFLQDVSLGVIADTLLGPVLLGGSIGEDGASNLFFAIGSLF